MAELYPPSMPYEHGMLDVGDGPRIYWETCGNPAGKPAVMVHGGLVHGGPGSGCSASHRRGFDPRRYRAVLFDQRGCGRSTPHASDPATDLSVNTTDHLIGDMERPREHLGIDRWLLHGGSWGSTLILAYAQRYPHRVTEIVIASVTMSRRSEIDWLYRGVGRFFPEAWERFRDGVPEADRDGDLLAGYARLMDSPNSGVREQAAGCPGRTRSSRRSRTVGATSSPTVRRQPRWRSCASARTTSRTAPGWMPSLAHPGDAAPYCLE